ncbi:16S rRNA (cytosine(1402)-N(4))-methyltransferase RsmH [Candidatus Latescibacterota bacterium]
MSENFHIPVMVSEIMKYMNVEKNGLYLDCTLGGGGHSKAILEKDGAVIAVDRDKDAVQFAEARLSEYSERFKARVARFSTIFDIAGENAGFVDGVLMDLGVSSRMIDDPSRGFSYISDGPLLMNMEGDGVTAFDIVNTFDTKELSRIFKEYGEERFARRIADNIVKSRSSHPIESTKELAEIIETSVGGKMPQKSKARIFQSLRIYINDEINELRKGLDASLNILKVGGRLCVISYHSIEDRIVKRFMKENADPCICPPDLPVCDCGRKPKLNIITRKALRPTKEEMNLNSRSRSALLRVAEKIGKDC